VTLVTRVGPGELVDVQRSCDGLGIHLYALPSLTTTTFAFQWDERGRRILRLRARARGIAAADLPPRGGEVAATLFGSIAHELASDLFGSGGGVRVLAAQGQLRSWDADGTVRPAEWSDATTHIGALTAVVISEEDVGWRDTIPVAWSKLTPVVLTLADSGARLYEGGAPSTEVPAFKPVAAVDATGAGDAFTSGLTVALAEGHALPYAMRFASAVASFCVEGQGTAGLATREDVERRLRD
jgi:pfkB family carbohydrate kinase